MVEKPEVYKSEPVRTTVLWLALVAEIAASAIVMAVVVAAGDGTLRMPDTWLAIYQATVKAFGFTPVIAVISLAFWIFRANKNATALSSEALEHGPGWAAGWFFVPIASLWKPYEVMREIYKASRTPHDWRKAKGASIVGWWWGLYLFGSAMGLAVMIASSNHDKLPLRRFSVALYAAMIIHQSLLLIITGRIAKWQAAAHRSGGVEAVF